MKKLLIVLTVLALFAGFAFAEGILVGEKPVKLEISGKDGGRLDKTPWCSSELNTTAWCLFYVDPDESDLNTLAEETLDAEDISKDLLKTVAVINYKATKLPAFAVTMVLNGKQKKYPDTLYLKDGNSVFVNKWGLTDNTYCTLVFNKNGVLVYRKDGKMSEEDVADYIKTIKANL
ncbi:MAG: transcriptional regulator [Candidatus Marinimicrobia bacterium]|nr:transcriptional regulator [Candidatus Neomarinimicrobiota bacterium]